MTPENIRSFATPADLHAWLKTNHAKETQLWVKIYKKDSGTQSITWNDCVIACIAWGWIDGVKNSLDADAYLQRITPRKAGSNWSQKNVKHAERLIETGEMQPAGMALVEAAKQSGKWDSAYAGSADMVIPEDFMAEVNKDPKAKQNFDALKRTSLFTIYHRLHSAKRPETRDRRIADFVTKLSRGEPIT